MNDFTFTHDAMAEFMDWYDIDELQNIKIISCTGHYDD